MGLFLWWGTEESKLRDESQKPVEKNNNATE
jgi:hypothetical protein